MAAMDDADVAESPTRARTRRAILDAAVDCWGLDSSASLGDIAGRAGVSRTTLHRYFPDRADLLQELARHVGQLVQEAVERARPDSGHPLEALRRLAEEHYDLGPILLHLYEVPAVAEDTDVWSWSEAGTPDPLEDLLTRLAPDLRPELPVSWLRESFWSLLYVGWGMARRQSLPRHEILDSTMLLFTRGALQP